MTTSNQEKTYFSSKTCITARTCINLQDIVNTYIYKIKCKSIYTKWNICARIETVIQKYIPSQNAEILARCHGPYQDMWRQTETHIYIYIHRQKHQRPKLGPGFNDHVKIVIFSSDGTYPIKTLQNDSHHDNKNYTNTKLPTCSAATCECIPQLTHSSKFVSLHSLSPESWPTYYTTNKHYFQASVLWYLCIASPHCQTPAILSSTPEPGAQPALLTCSQCCCNYWGNFKGFPRTMGRWHW